VSADELAAADTIAALFGGTTKQIDGDGPGDNEHDWDIRCPDGRRIALEVTFPRDPKVMGFGKALKELVWPAKLLQDDWVVSLRSPDESTNVNVKALRGSLETDMQTVISRGIDHIPDIANLR
jgi:hypothetical protein